METRIRHRTKMNRLLGWLALVSIFSGCLMVPPEPQPPPTTISSYGPFGGFTMSSGANCAGHATLTNGFATIQDPCFSGNENVVICTDTSSPSAVSCAPSSGQLMISGYGSDTVAYARVK
jgi:hypothetical protein